MLPPPYWCYPHVRPDVISTALNNLNIIEAIPHSTAAIPPQYW